jgi:hypothetical protein
MEILDQLHWSPGRRWTTRGIAWEIRGSILMGCAGWVEESWCTWIVVGAGKPVRA